MRLPRSCFYSLDMCRRWWSSSEGARFPATNSGATPVCIVGAGPVGLCLSLLLARSNIPSTILERRTSLFGDTLTDDSATSELKSNVPPHPRAHVLNSRTMEIFREMGLESEVRALAPPLSQWSDFRYCESLVGEDFAVDKHLSSSRPRAKNLRKHTPSFITHVSQPRLEALLLSKVRELPDMIDLQLGAEVENVQLPGQGHGNEKPSASVTYRRRNTDSSGEPSSRSIESRFICAADGATSPVRQAVGIQLKGEKALEKFASIHFTSHALAPLVNANVRGAMLYFVMNPSIIACVVAHDIEAGSWVAQVPVFPPHSAFTGNESDPAWRKYCEEAIDACVGLPGLDRTIHSSRVWSMDMLCAESFSVQKGNNWVFLVGDSAHQLPPSGGFGLNTGVQDVHNLAWKLAVAAEHTASSSEHVACASQSLLSERVEDLLHSYTKERRPVALANLAVSKDNYIRGLSAPKAVGLNRDLIAFASNALDNTFASALLPASLRAQILETGASAGRTALLGAPARGFAGRRIEQVVKSGKALPLLFPAHDIGYKYDSSAESSVAESISNNDHNKNDRALYSEPGSLYVPSVLSGSRFPHVWLRRKSGDRPNLISSLDLICNSGHVLFIAETSPSDDDDDDDEIDGELIDSFCKVHTADYSVVPLRTALRMVDTDIWPESMHCDMENGDDDDETELAWATLWGAPSGKVLVRPDGHIV